MAANRTIAGSHKTTEQDQAEDPLAHPISDRTCFGRLPIRGTTLAFLAIDFLVSSADFAFNIYAVINMPIIKKYKKLNVLDVENRMALHIILIVAYAVNYIGIAVAIQGIRKYVHRQLILHFAVRMILLTAGIYAAGWYIFQQEYIKAGMFVVFDAWCFALVYMVWRCKMYLRWEKQASNAKNNFERNILRKSMRRDLKVDLVKLREYGGNDEMVR